MGLEDYISWKPNQRAKKISAYDDEFIVPKLKIISPSVNSLSLKSTKRVIQFKQINTSTRSCTSITPKIEATHNAINLLSTHATRVLKHDSYLSPAPRSQITNTSCIFNNLMYAYPALQIPNNTSLAKRNTTPCKQSFQNPNEMYLA